MTLLMIDFWLPQFGTSGCPPPFSMLFVNNGGGGVDFEVSCGSNVIENSYFGSGQGWSGSYNTPCADGITISATNKNFIHHATISFNLNTPNDFSSQGCQQPPSLRLSARENVEDVGHSQ